MRELSVVTAGVASSLLDLGAGASGGFLLPLTLLPPVMILGCGRQSDLGLWNLQQKSSIKRKSSQRLDWVRTWSNTSNRGLKEGQILVFVPEFGTKKITTLTNCKKKNFRLNRPFRDLCRGISTEHEQKFRTKSCNI